MSEQQDEASDVTSTSPETVSLTIDYGNGAQKSFAAIPLSQEMVLLQVLEAAGSIKPGVEFEFNVTLDSDRSGRQRGFIASIDGVEADQTNQQWVPWINERPEDNELATTGDFSPGYPQVAAGDVVSLKLETV